MNINNINQIKTETEKILNNSIESTKHIDKKDISYKRVYKGWVSAISVDIRNFKQLSNTEKPENITRIIQSFATGIIKIGKTYQNIYLFSSLNGDEVILVYKAPFKDNNNKIYKTSMHIKGFLDYVWVKKIWSKYNINLEYGIGIGDSSNDIVCKYGQKYSKDNNEFTVMGSAINIASILSDHSNINKIKCNYNFWSNLNKEYQNHFQKLNFEKYQSSYYYNSWK